MPEDDCQSCNRKVANKSFAINRHSPRSIAWMLYHVLIYLVVSEFVTKHLHP